MSIARLFLERFAKSRAYGVRLQLCCLSVLYFEVRNPQLEITVILIVEPEPTGTPTRPDAVDSRPATPQDVLNNNLLQSTSSNRSSSFTTEHLTSALYVLHIRLYGMLIFMAWTMSVPQHSPT